MIARFTPIALAVSLLPVIALAQPAPANNQAATSADSLEAKSLFETSGQGDIGTRPFSSFLAKIASPVSQIALTQRANNLPADGVGITDIKIELFGTNRQPVRGEQFVTIEVTGGARILLPGRLTSESGADKGDIDKVTPGTQAKVVDGVLQFKLIAPYKPETVVIRVSVPGASEKIEVRYVPDLRELVAVGLIEGRLRSDKFDAKAIVPVTANDSFASKDDGFEEELKGFNKEFNGGSGKFGARAALYLKGKVKGDYLLTMAYDSDKDTKKRLFESIDPNAFYPVYGDSSLRTQDAQSTGKLYVRLDKNLNYLLLGDYTTSDPNPARRLGQYNRTLPGLRGHLEEGNVVANAFVARESFKQVVDEFGARGVSGPYSVSNRNGIKGTERVELIVRKRDQTSIILKTTQLTREVDYEFEPFGGQIVFRASVPSVDDQLNPVSIRITYEIDQGGKNYFIYGADAQYKISNTLSVGASFAKDDSPSNGQTVVGANIALKLTKNTEIIAELARSKTASTVDANGLSTNSGGIRSEAQGNAARIEIRHADEQLRANAYVQKADNGFVNPAGGLTGGKQELGGTVAYKATERITITGDIQRSTDKLVGSENTSASIAGDLKLSDRLTVGVGARRVEQNSVSLAQQSTINCPTSGTSSSGNLPGYNTGFGISQTGNQNLNDSTGLPPGCGAAVAPVGILPDSIERTGIFVRAGYQVNDQLNINGELQKITGTDAGNTAKLGLKFAATKNIDLFADMQRGFGDGKDNNSYRLGADWRVADKTRIYSRYEYAPAYSASYGLGVGELSKAFALGIDTQYMQDGSLFSEYRLNDSGSGRSIQNAIGLRNGWHIAEGLRLQTSAEYLRGASGDAKALGLGAEYTASPLWKGSARINWRGDQGFTNWLFTASAARKLDRDWTFIAREYLNIIDPKNGSAETHQNRFQVGFAFRPVDNNQFDALGLYEQKTDKSADRDSNANIISLRANYHPSRPWWVTGRLAHKRSNDLFLNGTESARSSYSASLIGGRVTYDITNRWSIGAISTMLADKGGRQFGYGLEVGYTVMDNLIVGLGYNWRGFNGGDLVGNDYTNRGWVLNMRYKFDEDLFKGGDRSVNRTLDPQGTPATGTGAAPANAIQPK